MHDLSSNQNDLRARRENFRGFQEGTRIDDDGAMTASQAVNRISVHNPGDSREFMSAS